MNLKNHSTRQFLNNKPVVGSNTYIDQASTVIGDVTLGDDVSIWPEAVVRGDVNKIIIGNETNIQDGAILHVTHDGPYTQGGTPLIIGQGVTVGHKAVLHACQIGDYCLIGIGAIVLDDVIIEDYVMIGAGSLVPPNKTLRSGYLYLGNPAKLIRQLTDKEIEKLKYSAKHYTKLKNLYA